MEPTREQAWATLTHYTKSEALLRHALAVEASTAFYARRFGEDEELWRVTALLHDFDYEIHPTLDKHPQDGAPILREEGYPEVVIEAVLSHAEHLAMPRDTPLKKTLFACDELSGFVHACGLVRPTGLDGLEPKSVRKKLKQPSFAAGVHRDEVYAGAELLGLELDEHIANVVEALQPIAPELGLRTAPTRPRAAGLRRVERRPTGRAAAEPRSARPAVVARRSASALAARRRRRGLDRRLLRRGAARRAGPRRERRGALRLGGLGSGARRPRRRRRARRRFRDARARPGALSESSLPSSVRSSSAHDPQRRRERAAHEAAADEDVVHARPGGRVARRRGGVVRSPASSATRRARC